MLLQEGHAFMVNWPLEQRLSGRSLDQVREKLRCMGFRLWDSDQMHLCRPFSSGSMRCELEGWKNGLVVRFPLDPYPPAFIPWELFDTANTKDEILQFLIKNCHPLRFSPYGRSGPGRLFVGREAELSLLLSNLPGLLIVGASGVGKSTLLLRATEENGGGFLNCQGFGYLELEQRLKTMARNGNMPQILFLDELDYLVLDPRTLRLLTRLNHKGIAWRGTIHEVVQGLGPCLELRAPAYMGEVLKPLEIISGGQISSKIKKEIVSKAMGNIGKLHRICHYILQQMGSRTQNVTPALVEQALLFLEVEGEGINAKRIV